VIPRDMGPRATVVSLNSVKRLLELVQADAELFEDALVMLVPKNKAEPGRILKTDMSNSIHAWCALQLLLDWIQESSPR
jgi:hypothetical protein